MNCIEYLSRIISEYDKIFLINNNSETAAKFYENGDFAGKVLILTSERCEYRTKKVTVRSISADEEKEIEKLYHTYEFSDNFMIVDEDCALSPSLFNFVYTGIIRREEMYRALFS